MSERFLWQVISSLRRVERERWPNSHFLFLPRFSSFFPLFSTPDRMSPDTKKRGEDTEERKGSYPFFGAHTIEREKKRSHWPRVRIRPVVCPPLSGPSLAMKLFFLVHSERRRRRRQMHSGGNEIDPWPDKSVRMFSQLSELDFLLFCPYQKSLLISRPFIARPFVIRRNNDRGRK